jgi:hypothetical protein
MGMSLVSASTPQGINNLLERAETGMQSLIWVGAEKEDNAKWRWPEAPHTCPLSEREFYPGDFTCHESAEGVSLLEAQQLCRAEGRRLKIPQNHQRATLQRISMSCPGFTRGCRICGAGTPEQEIIQYVCVDPTDPTGKPHGEQYVHAPARNWGPNEAVCVLQSGVWISVTVKMMLEYFEGIHAPGLTCNDLSGVFETLVTATAPCSGIKDTKMKRVAGARDVDFSCDVGSEPRILSIDSDVDRANLIYSCCPAQCSASGGRYHAFFCEGQSSYNADNKNKCLAVFKFEKELQYISVDCSQNLSYVCQNPAVPVETCDNEKCRGPDGQGGYDCYADLQQHEDMICAQGFRSQSIGEPLPFEQTTLQVCWIQTCVHMCLCFCVCVCVYVCQSEFFSVSIRHCMDL